MLKPSQVAALHGLVDEALDQPAARREAWIEALQGTRGELRDALRRALARLADEEGEGGGDVPLATLPRLYASASGDDAFEDLDAVPAPGHRVGPWRLERRLGAGGMGEVWLAARADGAYEREVALKLPRADRLGDGPRRRFARERDILAALAHPHIAQFVDAGVDERGRPWIAMERVDGRPLTAHAESQGLPVEARLALFVQVLQAVAHAHARLVAHRDLKPSNILVTAEGTAKLLDFGIAKLLLDEDTSPGAAAAHDATTRAAGAVLTPEYAAPEQLAGEPVTTAVDVYAAGLVLFELLAGQPPFPRGRRALAATTEAPLASTRVPDTTAGLPDAPTRRRALRGDLDAVLARALDPDPARRYASADAFAADVGRVLRGEPVQARRIGRLARAWKFALRHRVETSLAAALTASVAIGVGVVAWEGARSRESARVASREAERARAATAQAEAEARRATATRDFLVGVFKSSDPRIASDQPRGAITARQLLDLGARGIDAHFAADPDTRIQLLGLVADIYAELEEGEAFKSLVARQAELARARYGELHPVTLNCGLRQADFAINEGDFDGAKRALARLDPLIARAGLDGGVERAYWWLLTSWAAMNEPHSAPARQAALEKARALYEHAAPDDSHLAFVLGALGNLAHAAGDEARAADLTRRSIAVAERAPDRDDGALAVNYTNLGKTLAYLGDFDGADAAHARAVQLAEATYGRGSWPYWTAESNRAQAQHLRGDRVGADARFEALATVLPPATHVFRNALEENAAARVRETWGQRLVAEGRPEAALPLLADARTGFTKAPTYEWDLRQLKAETGLALAEAGRLDEAARALQGAVDEYAAKAPAGDPGALRAREAMARVRWRQGRIDEARAGWTAVLHDAGDRPLPVAALAGEGLARLALAAHDVPKAAAWLDEADRRRAGGAGAHDDRLGATLGLARAQVSRASGRVDVARSLARQALAVRQREDAPGSRDVREAEALVAALGG